MAPALSTVQSWFQGSLHSRRTRAQRSRGASTSATSALILSAVSRGGSVIGLYVGLAALVLSTLAQTVWLWYRSRPARAAVRARDTATP